MRDSVLSLPETCTREKRSRRPLTTPVRTIFAASRSPRPPVVLPTGRRSLFDAISKAREDADSAKVRHARESAAVKPTTPRGDTAIQPTSYTLAAAPAQGGSQPSSDNGASTSPTGNNAGPAPSAERTANAHRGLVGLLFQSWDH